MLVELLGWTALAIVIPATWPQIIKNFQRKSAEGVSFLTFIALFTAMTLFFVVSLLEPTPLSVTANFGLSMLGYGLVLFQMMLYKKR